MSISKEQLNEIKIRYAEGYPLVMALVEDVEKWMTELDEVKNILSELVIAISKSMKDSEV